MTAWATRLAIANATAAAQTRVWAAAVAAAEEAANAIVAEATATKAAIHSSRREPAMWECRPDVAFVIATRGAEVAVTAAAAVISAAGRKFNSQ